MNELLPVDRFLHTLHLVAREGEHLLWSWRRLMGLNIDTDWVKRLDAAPEMAERLEAFVSRFGCLQDTIADKLLPRWLLAQAETPGSQIETLNRAEKLGVLPDVEQWLEARKLRNRLVHEYMTDPAGFAESINLAVQFTPMLIEVYNRVRNNALERMKIEADTLPLALPVSG